MQQPACQEDVAAGLYEEAKLVEYITVLTNDVFGEGVSGCKRAMPTKWHLTEKADCKSDSIKRKARLVCQGFRDTSPGETYMGTPDVTSKVVVLKYIVSRPEWSMQFIDVTGAYLQAEVPADIACKPVVEIGCELPTLPEKCPIEGISESVYNELKVQAKRIKRGSQYILNKSLYGSKSAPYFFGNLFKTLLEELLFVEIAEGFFLKRDDEGNVVSVVLHHVDDVLIGEGVGQNTVDALREKLKCKQPVKLGDKESIKFLGMNIRRDGNKVTLSLDHYLAGVELTENKLKPVTDRDLEQGEPDEVLVSRIPEYRAGVGKVLWAVSLRPDQKVFGQRLAEHSTSPTAKHFDALERTLQALRRNPHELELTATEGPVKLGVFTDASFSNKSKNSRRGYKVCIVNDYEDFGSYCPIAWCSRTTKRLLDSSTSAELMALKLAVKHLLPYRQMIQALWGGCVPTVVFTDSVSLLNQLRTGKLTEERCLQPELDYTMQELRRNEFEMVWVERKYQLADPLTKLVWFDRSVRE
eukprot:GHVU01145780.1.p1 GENE.GHVU01145780.1~~GHVU01145780.1.p1  ORF type:complete len:526 (-),score=64.21 GHVU01145780.1:300-1877(-)